MIWWLDNGRYVVKADIWAVTDLTLIVRSDMSYYNLCV